MTSLERRPGRAVTPAMIVVSAVVHGTFVVLLVLMYKASWDSSQRPPTTVGRVRLVEAPTAVETDQKPRPGPAREPRAVGPIEVKSAAIEREIPQIEATIVETKSATLTPEKQIRLKKRKRPPKKLETPKLKSQNAAEKKDDPDMLIERRLFALRQQLEKEKPSTSAETSEREEADSAESRTQTAGPGESSDEAERELIEWFHIVRERINSGWSVFRRSREPNMVAVIGIQIADDGTLIAATIETGSGDEIFDSSALRAVYQAAPFPRTPPSVRERIRLAGGLALRFTPGGLE